MLFRSGDKLYFTSERKGGLDNQEEGDKNNWGQDIYFVNKKGTGWDSPILLPEPINSYDNDEIGRASCRERV